MTVDILCKVVDNLGDIGFVYRLARALSELPDAPRLRLIVDDLASFASLCPGVKAGVEIQTVNGWTVARWTEPGAEALSLFRAEPPRFVLECYACGRPPWFEEILFDPADPDRRLIVNLEYLTAETWSVDFHRLPSLTRSPLVRKAVFMPGFREGTGGLILDSSFCSLVDTCATRSGRLSVRNELLRLPLFQDLFTERCKSEAAFWVLVFSYEHDFHTIVADLAAFHAEKPLLALVAAGRSQGPFLDAWNDAGCLFPVLALPLLPQETWDALLTASDFTLVRGEESFSRSCLAGQPFLWQCYPFPENDGTEAGHLMKVTAFLDLLHPYLETEDFVRYERLTLAFNGNNPAATGPGDLLAVLRIVESLSESGISAGFRSFAREIRKIGNLASKVLTFMRDME